MKNMKLKVIALVLVIPLILIFTTSSVTKTIDLLVDVPVSSVHISEIANKSIDISTGESITVETVIEPKNATNQTVNLTQEPTKGKENNLAKVKIEGNKIIPLSKGNVTVRATVGEKFDTVDLYFYSSYPMDGDVEFKEDEIYITEGYQTSVLDNLNLKIETPTDISFSVSDQTVASVNELYGTLRAKTPGKTSVSMSYGGITLDENGVVGEKHFEQTFTLIVGIDKTKNPSGISFGDQAKSEFVDIKKGQTQSEFYFWYDENEFDFSSFKLDYDAEIVADAKITEVRKGKAKVQLFFYSLAEIGKDGSEIVVCSGENRLASYKIVGEGEQHEEKDDDPTAILLSKNNVVIVQKSQSNYQVYASILDQNGKEIDENLYYADVKSSNESILKIRYRAGGCQVVGVNEGEVTVQIVLKRKSDGTTVLTSDSIKIVVVKPYSNITIDRDRMNIKTKKSALDGVVAIGRYSYRNGEIVDFNVSDGGQMPISGTLCTGESSTDLTKIVWTSSDETIATVKNGVLVLGSNSGEVVLTAKNSAITGVSSYDEAQATITINVVQNGVNVSDETELLSTWKTGEKAVVLIKDIRLASFLDEYINSGGDLQTVVDRAKAYLKTMRTTGEGAFYVNNGNENKAQIGYLFEITTDLYGNGYSIDADALTRKMNTHLGSPIFKGPLDLVSYAETAEQNASVKAQDNIVFLIQKDDLHITNVELKGCSDSSLLSSSGDNVDLTLLDLVGTVVEIVGNNCSISYSRINNGRTVVRCYGRAYQSEEIPSSANADKYRINANISNSILGYGREFILKIGTNYTKKIAFDNHGIEYLYTNYSPNNYKYLYDEASPYLTKENGENYDPTENNINDPYYYNNYVLTDITVENCVFRNAGLFSVGLDSMFGGLCLHGFDYNSNYLFGHSRNFTSTTGKKGIGWQGVAGTSYPAVLRLKGDVRFYDWKLLSSVNSDTLIEGSDTLLNTIGLNMNVSKLIETYSAQEGNSSIVSVFVQDKQKYVNGAIAFYGGGKNYSAVDVSGTNSSDLDENNRKFEPLKSYTVPVSCFIKDGRTVLINYTAGAEPFRFYLYDATSELSVAKQQNDFNDGTAFSWLMRK